MKDGPHRKTPRFFVIKPIEDRRSETRFESEEPVKVQILGAQTPFTGTALDIGHYGLRLESTQGGETGDRVQIEFTRNPENIGCFGQVAWCESNKSGTLFACGIAIESWYGIVDGPQSWKRLKGVRLRRDRRDKLR